jgi:alkaline phosphatase D
MPPVSRRDLLKAAAAVSLAPLLAACGESAPALDQGAAAGGKFLHGVASGDPLSDAVILWTRLTPDLPETAELPVDWLLALDPELSQVVQRGTGLARAERDYTLKLDLSGLQAGQTYYYQFRSGAQRSPLGRTRTAPAGAVESLRLGVVTCGDYARGLFNAYRRVAARDDLQAVLHLGDYIYENGRLDDVRPQVPPYEILSLADYRLRYATLRGDADLQALHQQHPMIWVWDDHELANNAWKGGAEAHDPETQGDFFARRAAAFRAAHEWMPIRTPDAADLARIYRRFVFGDLVDLLMIDARQVGRDQPAAPNTLFGETVPVFTQSGDFADEARHILGAEQEQWLVGQLAASTARWKLLGNQVYFSPLKLIGAPRATGLSLFLSNDKWDGYEPARDRVLEAITAAGNVVILTGDAHEAYAFDVSDDPNNPLAYNPLTGEGSKAVELVVTSISTRGDGVIGDSLSARLQRLPDDAEQLLRLTNPHLKYYNNTLNGYTLLDINAERVQAEFWFVPLVSQPTDEESLGAVFRCDHGSNRLRQFS